MPMISFINTQGKPIKKYYLKKLQILFYCSIVLSFKMLLLKKIERIVLFVIHYKYRAQLSFFKGSSSLWITETLFTKISF